METIYNYHQLTDKIATSGQPTTEQLGWIAQAGYKVVVNIALIGTEYSLENEVGIVHDLGMIYIHLPVIWEDPTAEDFECFAATLKEHQDKKIFVHCAANMRVSVFMALYRILQLGWEIDLAFAEVFKIWEPNATWRAFIELMLNQEE